MTWPAIVVDHVTSASEKPHALLADSLHNFYRAPMTY